MIEHNSTISFRLPSEALIAIAENKEKNQSYHDYCKQLVLNALGIEVPTFSQFNMLTFEEIIDNKVQCKLRKEIEQLNYKFDILQTQVEELKKVSTKSTRARSKIV